MIRKFVVISVILVSAYVALIQWKLWMHVLSGTQFWKVPSSETQDGSAQRVYSFSFSKYTEDGKKELEIEGDSADILSQNVGLINVIAKAYAEESPVTITADQGSIDRSTNNILLHKNVVATTENGTRLLTEKLEIHPDSKNLATDVEAKVKKDNINIQGIGAQSDSQLNKVTFKKNVTVVIQSPEAKSKSPTIITSDGPLDLDYKRDVAHFSKNVVARHDQGVLTADYMDVLYHKETSRLSKIIARGNVVIVSKDGTKTFSDSAVYLAKEKRIVLGGDVETQYDPSSAGVDGTLF
ncbi:MAG: LPS export ABC transporter periplasmic protein LptC [Candidatus Omnitrophica bacterium]|nr:LPS export ABC transporter periplasmic protein LptC [Candidatus Omnitrophota bacterium]